MSKDKKKSVKELNAEFELLAERVKKLEEKDASEDPDKVQEKLNGIEEILKRYDKKIGDLDRELLQARHDNKIEKGKDSKRIDGEVCDKTLKVNTNLKEHTKPMHPKTYECKICDETFTESWKMEEHLEHHGNERPFKCSICEKGFYMKWRMEKHKSDHRVDIKFCHYFNNDKPCPYDKVGCKFKHETAPEKGKDSKRINGEVCDKTLKVNTNLKEHTKPMHPKTYECKICDKTFTESWKMEEHLEHHGIERPFKCSICEKGFYMKWRMEKHTRDHRVDIKFCHYFNNDKPCPYDEVGCKFKHETAPECRCNLKCTFKLCQFTHTTKKGEEVVHRQELETLNEGVGETRGHLLPAIISTDRTKAHREFMKLLEDAEAVEMNEESHLENDYDDSEDDSTTDIDIGNSVSSDEEEVDTRAYKLWRKRQMEKEDSDSSDEEEIDHNQYIYLMNSRIGMNHKSSTVGGKKSSSGGE